MIRGLLRFVAPAALACAGLPALAESPAETDTNATAATEAEPTPAGFDFGDPTSRPDLWRAVDPENLLVIDTTKGRILVELATDFAPGHAARIKSLAREGFYDGTKYHRVIDGFMAQGGDPTGTGAGGSNKPDLQQEFTAKVALGSETVEIGREIINPSIISQTTGEALSAYTALRDGFPVAHFQSLDALMSLAEPRAEALVLHCPGSTSMARSNDENSANSQYFLMRATYPSLNAKYTTWGRVVDGLDVVRAIKVFDPSLGDAPPPDLDAVVRMRVAADLADAQRPRAWVLRTEAAEFRPVVEAARAAGGPKFGVCDVEVPSFVEAAGESLDDDVDDLLSKMRR